MSISRRVLEETGGFDVGLDRDRDGATAQDVALAMRLHSSGVPVVYGRWALAFHQRVQPLRSAEAPEYFADRIRGVREVEPAMYAAHGSASAYAAVTRKRAATDALTQVGLSWTDAGARRLAADPARDGRIDEPLVSVLLVHDGSVQALRDTLNALDAADSAVRCEVLVLDPTGTTWESCEEGSSAEAVVQLTPVRLSLRYFPTGTSEYRRRVARLRRRYQAATSGLRRRSILDELHAAREWYESYMRTMLHERPLGMASAVLSVSRARDAGAWLTRACDTARAHLT